jgi:hypothetical protein
MANGLMDTLKSAVTGTIEGASELAITAAGTASGAARAAIIGFTDVSSDVVKLGATTAESIIETTRKIALEVEQHASTVGRGAAESAKDISTNLEEAATGAYEGARELGHNAMDTARTILDATIEKVRRPNGNGHTHADEAPSAR